MKLDALEGEGHVTEAHHDSIDRTRRSHLQLGRQCGRVDAQGVVTGGCEAVREAGEQAGSVVVDLGRLAVHQRRCPNDRGPERCGH